MIRQADIPDLPKLVRFDATTISDKNRIEEITEAIILNKCWVYCINEEPVGYGIINSHFFHQAFISLVYVSEKFRRKGIAAAIIKHLTDICGCPKIFTSTNQSNKDMQSLLNKIGFEKAGEVSGLDEGDPEVFYIKRL